MKSAAKAMLDRMRSISKRVVGLMGKSKPERKECCEMEMNNSPQEGGSGEPDRGCRLKVSPPPPCSTAPTPKVAPVNATIGPPVLDDTNNEEGCTELRAGTRNPAKGEMRMEMPLHEVALLFPPMGDDEYRRLCDDILKNGLKEPIWTFEGHVVDGRHRLKACRELGIEPTFREWDGIGSLIEFAFSKNFARRHLSQNQRVLLAAKLRKELAVEAEERMKAGKAIDPGANLPQGRSAELAAEAMKCGSRTVATACKVVDLGIPELVHAVESGRLSISAAAVLAGETPERQSEILALDDASIRAQVKALNADRKGRGKRRRRGSKVSAPQATEEGGELVLRVGARWRSQLEAAMLNRAEFERLLNVGLKIKRQ